MGLEFDLLPKPIAQNIRMPNALEFAYPLNVNLCVAM